MTTFDLAGVRDFVADLDARMGRCQDGEGLECATLDAALRHHANLCCEFTHAVRRWGRAIFAGRAAYDPEVESVWLDEGARLYARALEMYRLGQAAEAPCYFLEGGASLHPALWGLYRLLKGWITPKLAVGPSARRGLPLDPSMAEEARRRIALLPPLPADWQPDDPQQRAIFRMLSNS